jgi:plasmid stabilization system protein ParE
MKLTYHPEAEAELVEAVQFYEHRVPGLGHRFRRAYESAVAGIQQTPTRWRIVEGDVRCYLVRGFPYSVYYRILDDALRILAVKHQRRHPDYWKGRASA